MPSQLNVSPEMSALVRDVVDEIQALPIIRPPAGLLSRELGATGVYVEEGLEFTLEDGVLCLLYSGLAVIARDMHANIAAEPLASAALFERVVSDVSRVEEQLHGARAFPSYSGLPVEDLPIGVAGTTSIAPLSDASIVHEWTLKPGKRLFTAFSAEFRDSLCGKNGLYEDLKAGKLGASEFLSAATLAMMATGFAVTVFWVPLCAFVAVLLVRTGVREFCGEKSPGRHRAT